MTTAVGYVTQVIPQEDSEPAGAATRAHLRWIDQVIKCDGAGILRMLWQLLQRESDVMDAYQDCFCKLAGLGDRPNLRSAKAYAYRTAMNVAIEMIRVRSRRRSHWPAVAAERTDVILDPPPQTDPSDADRLSDAIAQLPNHLRQVVVLRDLSRMAYAEVGRVLGIDPATARVYRRHAVVKLAELLGEGERE